MFSVFASILLWMYVTTVEEDESTVTFYGVDVQFTGEDNLRASKGFIITEVNSSSVNVTLRGSRSVLSSFGADDLTAVIDVTNVSRVGSAEKQPSINYPSHVNQSNISVVSIRPTTISYYVDKEITKTVPVQGVFKGSVAEGYIRENFSFEPATVRISGPAAVVDEVDKALVTVEREDLDKTINFDSSYSLVDIDGEPLDTSTIEYESETVNVTLPVKATKEVPLTVDLVAGGGATDVNAVISCEPATITLAGDPAILDTLNSISVATIDLYTFDPIITKKCTIIIPNDVENITGETEVDVTVEVKGLHTARKTASNLTTNNLPSGFRAEIVSKNLDVVIRGTEESVKAVAANNIRVVGDLSGITTTGTTAVPAKVYVDGFADVGAVGEYEIYVTIERG